jgi:glycosyltransferase involved in cell wall biosynthesis
MRMDRYRIAMRVAFLAFYFPPDGGPGTQRPASWARHFDSHGIETTIFTRAIASDDARSRCEPRDESFAGWVSAVRVERIPWDPDPAKASRWRSAVLDAILAVHARRPFDLVLVTAPPFELVPLGGQVAARIGVPLVVDLRDAWVLDGIRPASHWLAYRRELKLMRESLEKADGIVTTTDAATRAVERLLGGSVPVRTVTNGFEPEDFRETPRDVRDDGSFRITFAGQFISGDALPPRTPKEVVRRLLRIRSVRIDPTGRSPVHLLEAIRRLRQREPALGRRLRFEFVGVVDPATAELIDRSGVADAVTCHGFVPHAEVIRRMRSADALFICLNGMPADQQPLVIPGKLFEYLAARRPVLAALPAGDARRIALAHADAVAVEPCDPDSIARGIARIAAGDLDSRNAGVGLERFTREALAGEMAAFLRRTIPT